MPFIGVDYGGRRIGVAISESGVLASPHAVIENDGETMTKLDALAREIGAETFVVGLARRTHSQAGERKFLDFAEALRQKTCKSVELWDETLSTVEANERLRASGRKSGKKDIDMYAAAVILQSYLDALARRTP
jgi:putative transcription antitermination factor YqgF